MVKSLLEQLPEIVTKERQEAELVFKSRHHVVLLYAIKCRGIAANPLTQHLQGVRDTGIGIAGDAGQAVTVAVHHQDARHRTGVGGENLTHANGGRVKVESEVGKITLFTITLPSGSAVS